MRCQKIFSVLSILCLTAALSLCSNAFAAPITVDPAVPLTGSWSTEWNQSGNREGWSAGTVSGGVLTYTAATTDSNTTLANFANGPDLDLGYNDFLEMRVKVPVNYAGNIQVFYGVSTTSGFDFTQRVLTIPPSVVRKDGAFHTYRLELGLEAPWRSTLRDLRLDLVGGTGTINMKPSIDYIRIGDEPSPVVYQVRTSYECPGTGGTTPPAATLGGGQAVMSAESKHFRFLWNAAVQAHGFWTADMPHGTLRNLEEAWQVFAKKLGYVQPNQVIGNNSATPKYKLNVISWYGGYWAGVNENFAYLNITPDGLRVDPPTWVIPHELMHCFQFHNNGGNMPGEWFEFHANYGRERWLQHYQNLYPNASGIDPTHLRSAHLNIGSGREYYLCWPFLLYLDENPDGLPDLGEGTSVKLWQQTGANEYPFMTLGRLVTTTSLKDIAGYYARRGATFNYSSKAAIQAALASFGEPLDNAATQRWQFTDLVQRIDDPTWWRVPYEMAPMQGAYAIHELVVPNPGTANRTVTVNLRGLPDSGRGVDWRASFIIISDNGSERYSSLWGNGTKSVTLSASENKLYLSVAGAPAMYYYGGADEAAYPYRSHPSKTRFPYELQVTGASPKQRDSGFTASTATIAPTAYVSPSARVIGNAQVLGNARIEDYAVVSGNAIVSGDAVVSGHAWVRGNAVVNGNAKVRDWALVEGGTITGSARVLEHANIKGGIVQDIATAKGSSGSSSGTLSGNAIIDGDYGDFFSGRDLADSIAFGHQPYVGVPNSFVKSLPKGLYASYDFTSAHDSRILDQYGVTDGFTVGSPTWTGAGKKGGALSFNGTNQFVDLDRSVADLRDFSFTAWVKPAGGATNQAVLWLGASNTKRLCFTPDDGTGHAKFSINNGGTTDQTLVAPTALPVGTWTQVTVTLDGTQGKLYINGAAVASSPITTRADQLLAGNRATALQHNYLARAQGTLMPMFNGSLDEVRFYGIALTGPEVAAMQPPTTVAKAGTLYVDLRASDASAGTSTWVNNGTLGNFTSVGTLTKTADVAGTGYPGVQFDGTSQAYLGPNSVADLDGSSDRSIEVWAYNPALVEEETTVSWGHRGAARRDMGFNFGNHPIWGAATHWDDDAGWSSAPGANGWHHLVYTYDGASTVKVYIDGALANTKTLNGALDTFASEPINIACQRESANGARTQLFSGYINTVRVHGGVLTDAQIADNYTLGPSGSSSSTASSSSAVPLRSAGTS